MIQVSINGSERVYEDGIEHWIHEQIDRRRANNAVVCTSVSIHQDILNMILQTSGCAGSPSKVGSTRQPNSQEARIYELWDKIGLNRSDYTAGQVVAFLKQFRRNS